MNGYSFIKNGKVYFSHLNPPRKGDMIKLFARLNERAPKGSRFEPLHRCEGGIKLLKEGQESYDEEQLKCVRFDFPMYWPTITKEDPMKEFCHKPDTVLIRGFNMTSHRWERQLPLILAFESHCAANKWTREEMDIVIHTLKEMEFVHKVTCVK